MPRKSALLLSLLNRVLKPIAGQAPAQSNQFIVLPKHPLAHDREEWRVHWQARGQPWRTEPEIDVRRQEYLAQRRAIAPDIKNGIYPFKGMKLSRADVEWLLATHENGRGPVHYFEESQRERVERRKGLDVRGADLRHIDLSDLPLARLLGGLPGNTWFHATKEQRMIAQVHLEGANLTDAHLEGAGLREAHLENANLTGAHLEGTNLGWAYLPEAILQEVLLERTRLENAVLSNENHIGPQLADIHWGNVNLSTVKWSSVKMLGEEHEAQQKKRGGKGKDSKTRLEAYETAVRANRQLAIALQGQGLNENAIHFAYRAQVLQKRVLWFQMIQRDMKLRQRMHVFGPWLFSWFLFLLAGYGYKLWRCFFAYVLVIIGFMTAYYLLGASDLSPLSLVNALGLSMTSFHGRGFFPGVTQLNDTLTILASIEAFVGLVLEATFIATLTQRFFGK